MATFDQRGMINNGQVQNAETMTNTGQQLTFGAMQTPSDLPAFLAQLQAAIVQATTDGTLSPATGTAAKAIVVEATEQATLPVPDKKSLLDHLTTAKTLIESVAATSALVPSIIAAIDAVHKWL